MSENEKKPQVKADKKVEKKPDKKKKGGIGKWFREMKSELKKVVWPTWNQVVKNTGIVIGMIIVVGLFIALADFLLQSGYGALMQLAESAF